MTTTDAVLRDSPKDTVQVDVGRSEPQDGVPDTEMDARWVGTCVDVARQPASTMGRSELLRGSGSSLKS